MGWFPTQRADDSKGWHFDIMSLLTVIGGSSIIKHKPAITASRFGFLPRLLPAPDTLTETDRPIRLPAIKDVNVYGVYSGTHFTELNYFADVLHETGSLVDYEFAEYSITHRNDDHENAADTPAKVPFLTRLSANWGLRSKPYLKNKVAVPIHTWCLLHAVTFVSVGMSIGLFIWAACLHDGVALIGIISMCLSTSSACLSSFWYPRLSMRPSNNKVPKADVVIKTRSGAMLVVHCGEEVGRELYGGVDRCEYLLDGPKQQGLLAFSTIMLMASIIFLSNSGSTMQMAIGFAYMILNVLYYCLSLFTNPRNVWDLSRYKVELLRATEPRYSTLSAEERETVENVIPKHGMTAIASNEKFAETQGRNFTETLYWAICATGSIDWAAKFKVAPDTEAWRTWLKEASEHTKDDSWDPIKRKDELMSDA